MAVSEPITAGTRFGRWTVMRIQPIALVYGARATPRETCECRCDCGVVRDVVSRNLLKGLSRSCGCIQDMQRRANFVKPGHKRCSRCKAVKPLGDFGPRKDRGQGAVRPKCKECDCSIRKAARDNASPEEKERALEIARQWKRDNPDLNQATKAEWEARNPEKVLGYARGTSRRMYAKDPAGRIAAQWRRDNAAKCRAKYKQYMTRKTRAMPSWANEFLIQQFYDCSTERNKLKTGGQTWHVDHIVPLNGKTVCGLHVQNNLQVLPGLLNLSKGNRFWPDMWPLE